MRCAIFIPAYNAGRTLEGVFDRIPEEALDKIEEFIVVNDGSCDDTGVVIQRLAEQYRIKAITNEQNQGYGAAQKRAYDEAVRNGFDAVVMLHADGQYAPEVLGKIIHPIEEDIADIVCGSRILGGGMADGGMPLIRHLGDLFVTGLQNVILGADLTTYHSGYRAYSTKALRKIKYHNFSDGFYFDTEMLIAALRNNLRIVEVPVSKAYPEGNVSYLNPLSYVLCAVFVTIKYAFGKRMNANGAVKDCHK